MLKKYVVHWKAVLITRHEGKETGHHGHIHDITLAGATVFIDEAINPKELTTLMLQIPQGKSIKDWATLEIECHATIVAAEEDHFRVGLYFKSFIGDGKHVLEEALRNRNAMSTPDEE